MTSTPELVNWFKSFIDLFKKEHKQSDYVLWS